MVGPYRFTHTASYQSRIIITNALFRLPVKARYNAVPWVTYTDPELAHVGISEAEARAKGHELRVLRFPFEENDRAIAEGATAGLVKVVATKRGRVLGASIVGKHAGELIPAVGARGAVPDRGQQDRAGDRALSDHERGERESRRQLPRADAVQPAHTPPGAHARPFRVGGRRLAAL